MNRAKEVIFPEEMLEILEINKGMSGESASSYIRRATARLMVADKLMKIKTKTVYVQQEVEEVKLEPAEGAMYCDADGCDDPRGADK